MSDIQTPGVGRTVESLNNFSFSDNTKAELFIKGDTETLRLDVYNLFKTQEFFMKRNVFFSSDTKENMLAQGFIALDGSTYQRAEFSGGLQHVIDIGLTTADDVNAISVVDLTGNYFKVSYVSVPGTNFGAQSLPNIIGKFGETNLVKATPRTAPFIYNLKLENRGTADNSLWANYEINIDLSSANPVYQNGASVNPNHVIFGAYIYGGVRIV